MQQLQKVLVKTLRQIGGPHAEALAAKVVAGEWSSLRDVTVGDPRGYRSPLDYRRARYATDLVKKLRLPGDEQARIDACKRKFMEAEHMCYETNRRFRIIQKQLRNELLMSDDEFFWCNVLAAWRAEVRDLLGPIPRTLVPRLSGGSTVSDHGKRTTIPDKLSSRPTIYASSKLEFELCTKGTIIGRGVEPLQVRSNVFFTVPKDSKTHRGCCMEASGSLMLQLALGAHLKQRYKQRTGHDLSQAKQVHMDLAASASRHGHLATIDLSMASDTIAKELVRAVLPSDWFTLLNSLRATSTQMDGRVYYLEKFSSMGNGFTFELETILFRSLAKVFTTGEVRCFGDDMIVPSNVAECVIAALHWAGFRVNTEKTFCDGPFRESCGGDYFEGIPVRGHFLEEPPCEPQQWIALANGLSRIGLAKGAAWWYCVDQVPSEWRVFGPEHLGDVVFRDDDAVPSWRPSRYSNGTCEPFWTVWVPVAHTFSLERHFDYLTVISAACLGQKPEVSVRGAPRGYKKSKILAWGLTDPSRLPPSVEQKLASTARWVLARVRWDTGSSQPT